MLCVLRPGGRCSVMSSSDGGFCTAVACGGCDGGGVAAAVGAADVGSCV